MEEARQIFHFLPTQPINRTIKSRQKFSAYPCTRRTQLLYQCHFCWPISIRKWTDRSTATHRPPVKAKPSKVPDQSDSESNFDFATDRPSHSIVRFATALLWQTLEHTVFWQPGKSETDVSAGLCRHRVGSFADAFNRSFERNSLWMLMSPRLFLQNYLLSSQIFFFLFFLYVCVEHEDLERFWIQ